MKTRVRAYILAILPGILFFSATTTAQPDRAAYLWRQGMFKTAERSLNSCLMVLVTVERYLEFAKHAEQQTATKYRHLRARYEKYEGLQAAAQNFKTAVKYYQETIATTHKAQALYKTAKASAGRVTDDTLQRAGKIVKRQFHDANIVYQQSKVLLIKGNTAFNAGNHQHNQAVEEIRLETDEIVRKRTKYHIWPAPN